MKYTTLLFAVMALMSMTQAYTLPEYVNIFGVDVPVLKETARKDMTKYNHVTTDKFTTQRAKHVSPKIRAKREAKGLSSPRLGSSVTEEDVEDLGAVSQFMLGIAYGSQYSESETGLCYRIVEDSIIVLSELGGALAEFYNPTKWGEVGVLLIDYTDVSSAIYADCDIQILFTTLSELFSIEGASSLGSRVAAGFIYELPQAFKTIKEGGSFSVGKGIGKMVSLFLNFYI